MNAYSLVLGLATDVGVFYYVMLMNFYPQVLVLENGSLRTAWTCSRHLPVSAVGPLARVLAPLIVLGALVSWVLMPQLGRWAEVLGSGLENLLYVVGVTVVYCKELEREEEEGGWRTR